MKLGELCSVDTEKFNLSDNELIDYIDISSVDNIEKKIIKYETCLKKDAPSRARKLVQKNDIIVSTVRPNLNAVALCDVDTPNITVVSTGFCVLRCKKNVDVNFIFNFCKSKSFIDRLVENATGASYPAVNDKIICDVDIPCYPLEKQKRISSEMNKVENLICLRKQQLQKLDELVKARFVELFGDTVNNSFGWDEHWLDEYIEFLTSGSRGWAQYFNDNGTDVFITIKNVKNNHIVLDTIQYIDTPNNKEAERTKVQAGDLLISITADLGRTGVVDATIANSGAYINQHLSLIRLNKIAINPMYVSYFLETEGGKRQFASKNQSAVKAGLNFEAIKSLKILVPPIEIQNKFVDFVQQIDKSKLSVQKSLDKLEILKKVLMQKYFG